MPLVANKDLVLRVYVNYPSPAGTVTGTVSYAGHPDLTPLNGPLVAMVAASIDRGDPNQTLNFRVPAAHCTGSVTFTVRVFDPAHISDATYSFIRTIALSFDTVPQLR